MDRPALRRFPGRRGWKHGDAAGPPLARGENLRHIRRRGREAQERAVGYPIRPPDET